MLWLPRPGCHALAAGAIGQGVSLARLPLLGRCVCDGAVWGALARGTIQAYPTSLTRSLGAQKAASVLYFNHTSDTHDRFWMSATEGNRNKNYPGFKHTTANGRRTYRRQKLLDNTFCSNFANCPSKGLVVAQNCCVDGAGHKRLLMFSPGNSRQWHGCIRSHA